VNRWVYVIADKRPAADPARMRRVLIVAFPGFQLLDVTGPWEVFARTTRWLREHGRTGGYALELAAARRGSLRSSSGLSLGVPRAFDRLRGAFDTLVVAGGTGVERALADRALVAFVKGAAGRARRVASVCTGAFLLAEAGLLDRRRATTHWNACARLAARYPGVRVDPDPIFVRDGRVWTSAGVTAGMDLALALVEEDHGREVALGVARALVLFLKRPGGQAQFSAQLQTQLAEREPLRDLQAWMADHPGADLSVQALARRVAMSPRHFARVFRNETGATPARAALAARVEAARRRLEDGDDGIEGVAAACGFGSAEVMRRAFLRTLRVGPAAYRRRFRRDPSARPGRRAP
jgi:transcriptional regulator GlxA family with amidase domain